MRFGACAGGIDRYIASVNAGCDFVELNARQVGDYSKEKFDETLALIKEYGVIAEATNCLFPGEIAISGSEMKPDVVNEYTDSLFYKLAQLGVKVSVFGSGGARSIPEGEDPDECMERFYKSIYITAENAKKNGITVALEPLRSVECNILNTVEKAAQICKDVNHSSVGINPDLYHMYNENEPFENLAKYIDYIKHVHIGDYTKRRYPTPDDGCEYSRILNILKTAGYTGRVSVESGTDDYENDCRQALTILRSSL
ncbi:MAG: sugar phosphate isomerase/epimerase [Clostridia bacterium]|nr:sugar phosphate isomerase/epimerase [Clostridia bacterium]